MLTRVLAVLGLVVGSVLTSSQVAAADEPVCYKTDPQTGVCLIWITPPPGGGGGGGGGGEGGGSSLIVLVIDGQRCVYIGAVSPQPPQSDPIWDGHTDGAIYGCETLNGPIGTTVILQFSRSATTPTRGGPRSPARRPTR